MIAKVILATERLLADLALIRPLICVRTHMNEKIVGFGEDAMTVAAYVVARFLRSHLTALSSGALEIEMYLH